MTLGVRQLLAPLSHRILRDILAEELAAERAGTKVPDHPRIAELEHIRRDGAHQWCEVTMDFIRDESGKVLAIEGVTRDITERKEFERELSAISTQEQQRLGQRLHDELGQQLLGLGLMAENLRKTLASKGVPEAACARELADAAREAQDCVRALIKCVRPVEVDASGLMAALAELANGTELLTGIPCTFECEKPIPMEDSHTATQLFHIASEAVRNAVKHGKPTRIVIGLTAGDSQVTLWVRDDGLGIGSTPDQSTGMGLRIMRYRAGVIGGALTIAPSAQGGTNVMCILPLEP
jgi:signal transduction histidine kinase